MVLALESADETPLFGQGAGQHRGGIHTERPAVGIHNHPHGLLRPGQSAEHSHQH